MRLKAGTSFDASAILFDLDGTLVNSNSVVERLWQRWGERWGIDIDRLLSLSHGRRTIDTLRMLAPKTCDIEAECSALTAEELLQDEGISAVRGAIEILASLEQCPWAIVTSAPRDLTLRRLAITHLPIPPCLICAEDVGKGKPDPAGYLAAARRLGVDPRTALVIEDAAAGLSAAHASGAKVIAVSTTLGPQALKNEDWIEDLSCLSMVYDEKPHNIQVVIR